MKPSAARCEETSGDVDKSRCSVTPQGVPFAVADGCQHSMCVHWHECVAAFGGGSGRYFVPDFALEVGGTQQGVGPVVERRPTMAVCYSYRVSGKGEV